MVLGPFRVGLETFLPPRAWKGEGGFAGVRQLLRCPGTSGWFFVEEEGKKENESIDRWVVLTFFRFIYR